MTFSNRYTIVLTLLSMLTIPINATTKKRRNENRSIRVSGIVPKDPEKFLTACIDLYPGYDGDLRPYGEVMVSFRGPGDFLEKAEEADGGYPHYNEDLEFLFQFDLKGLRDHCKDCGIHIHEGTTCEDAALVGGHYWNDRDDAPDPWTEAYGATYRANNNGKTKGEFYMYTGYGNMKNKDHAVVVHDEDPTVRIGCGILRKGKDGRCGRKSDASSTSEGGMNAKTAKSGGRSAKGKTAKSKGSEKVIKL